MNTSLLTTVVPPAGSPLTRRGLLRAGLGGAALWACTPRSSAAIRVPSAHATTATQTLLAWTDLTLALIQETQPSPPRAARVLALVHVAMAEAALVAIPATSDAITAAAATVLRYHFPQAASRIAAVDRFMLAGWVWRLDARLARRCWPGARPIVRMPSGRAGDLPRLAVGNRPRPSTAKTPSSHWPGPGGPGCCRAAMRCVRRRRPAGDHPIGKPS
jgi:hypothetical protein